MTSDDNPKPQLERFMPKAMVASQLACSTKTIERMVRAGTFPQPIQVGGRVVFVEREIVTWQKERIQNRNKPMPVNYEVVVPEVPLRGQPLKELFPDMFEDWSDEELAEFIEHCIKMRPTVEQLDREFEMQWGIKMGELTKDDVD